MDHLGHESGLPLRNEQELSCVRSLCPRAISREYLSWKLFPTSIPSSLRNKHLSSERESEWYTTASTILQERKQNHTSSFLPFSQSCITIGPLCTYFPGWVHKILYTLVSSHCLLQMILQKTGSIVNVQSQTILGSWMARMNHRHLTRNI